MPQRKINLGNAESVTQRGRNVTIVPFSSDESISVAVNERRVIHWPDGIDIVGGEEPTNPDGIDVSNALFPGWRVYAYDCANSPCTATETDPLYVEIVNLLQTGWLNAYMVMRIEHAGASATDYLFRVTSINIKSIIADDVPVDLTYGASGMIVTQGVYVFQIAATAADGSKRMTMFTSRPDRLALVRNSEFAEAYYNSQFNAVTLYPAGLFERYDGQFMYPTGPNWNAASADLPFIIRFNP